LRADEKADGSSPSVSDEFDPRSLGSAGKGSSEAAHIFSGASLQLAQCCGCVVDSAMSNG